MAHKVKWQQYGDSPSEAIGFLQEALLDIEMRARDAREEIVALQHDIAVVDMPLATEPELRLERFKYLHSIYSNRLNELLKHYGESTTTGAFTRPPQFGERLLLLILTKEERVNIPGDLEEEYRGIAAKHGERFAKVWYYKQVAASAWPMIRKAVGWGLLASLGAWIRRII